MWKSYIFNSQNAPELLRRCAILFTESQKLGWRPLRDSFVASIPRDTYDEEKIACIRDMFDWLVPPCLNHVKGSNLFLPFSEVHLVTCQMGLFAGLVGLPFGELLCAAGHTFKYISNILRAGEKKGDGGGRKNTTSTAPAASNAQEESLEVDSVHMQMAFLFSILWGLCGTVMSSSRPALDVFFRSLVDGVSKGSHY